MSFEQNLELANNFSEIARKLVAENDAHATLTRIVRLAVDTIDNCQHAGITVIEGRNISSPASSDSIPEIVDRLQAETNEGPCLDAIRNEAVFYTGNLSKDSRWPNFASRAYVESGIESILSFRLFLEGDTMGALNLYSQLRDAFDEHDVAFGTIFATHAAVAWSTAKTIENLRGGITSRQLIGQATGILMARQNVDEEQAFEMLKRASQRLNIKLSSIAERVVRPKGDSESKGSLAG